MNNTSPKPFPHEELSFLFEKGPSNQPALTDTQLNDLTQASREFRENLKYAILPHEKPLPESSHLLQAMTR